MAVWIQSNIRDMCETDRFRRASWHGGFTQGARAEGKVCQEGGFSAIWKEFFKPSWEEAQPAIWATYYSIPWFNGIKVTFLIPYTEIQICTRHTKSTTPEYSRLFHPRQADLRLFLMRGVYPNTSPQGNANHFSINTPRLGVPRPVMTQCLLIPNTRF
jgi:hypothetical protein